MLSRISKRTSLRPSRLKSAWCRCSIVQPAGTSDSTVLPAGGSAGTGASTGGVDCATARPGTKTRTGRTATNRNAVCTSIQPDVHRTQRGLTPLGESESRRAVDLLGDRLDVAGIGQGRAFARVPEREGDLRRG